MPTHWASSVIVVLVWGSNALQLAFTLPFLSSVRAIVMDTESRTNPKKVIFWAGMKHDFSTLMTNPNLVKRVCVSEMLSRHSLVSLP